MSDVQLWIKVYPGLSAGSEWREPTVEELVAALGDEFWNRLAGYLSTIDFTPAWNHPEMMQQRLRDGIAEVVSE